MTTAQVVETSVTFNNKPMDLFTDTAAILNLLDLRSIMGCPGGTRSVFTRTFRTKRELQCIFLGEKAIIITSKHCTTIFFSHYNASISDRAHAPWAINSIWPSYQ